MYAGPNHLGDLLPTVWDVQKSPPEALEKFMKSSESIIKTGEEIQLHDNIFFAMIRQMQKLSEAENWAD